MDVIFDEEPPITARSITKKVKKESVLTRLIIATKLAKDPAEAQIVMLGIAIVAIVISVGLIVFILNPPRHPLPQSVLNDDLARMQGSN